MHAIVPVASWASVWSTRSAISWAGTSSPRSRCSSRIVRAREAIDLRLLNSVAQDRADALDRLEVLALLEGPDRAAVSQRLVQGEIEPVAALLHLRPVERAVPRLGGDPAASGALPGLVLRAVLEEEQLDPTVGGRLQRLRPAGGCASVPARSLPPALDRRRLLLRAPSLEQRLDRLQELGRGRARIRRRPADGRLLDLVRKLCLQLGARLLAHDQHDARPP